MSTPAPTPASGWRFPDGVLGPALPRLTVSAALDESRERSEESTIPVARAIARLRDRHPAALFLCGVEGLNSVAAASALGLSAAETRQYLHLARQALRTLLARRLPAGAW